MHYCSIDAILNRSTYMDKQVRVQLSHGLLTNTAELEDLLCTFSYTNFLKLFDHLFIIFSFEVIKNCDVDQSV